MDINKLIKKWLVDHEHYEDEPTFQKDFNDFKELIATIINYDGVISDEPGYDPNFGDDILCECTHPYYRHFDTYSNMDAIGCKYCFKGDHYFHGTCAGFKEKK
jgi:hypothetical protein